MATQTISIILPKELVERIKKDAEEQKRSRSSQINIMLSEYYKLKEKE